MTPSSTITVTLWTHPPAWKTISRSRPVSPEDILMEKETEREQEAARALMMERLREALATLTPRQASCLHARFWEGKPFKEFAEAEGFTTSAANCHGSQRHHQVAEILYQARLDGAAKGESDMHKDQHRPKRNRKKTSAKKS